MSSEFNPLYVGLMVIVSIVLFILLASDHKDPAIKRETEACEKFCELSRTEVKVYQTGVCLCK